MRSKRGFALSGSVRHRAQRRDHYSRAPLSRLAQPCHWGDVRVPICGRDAPSQLAVSRSRAEGVEDRRANWTIRDRASVPDFQRWASICVTDIKAAGSLRLTNPDNGWRSRETWRAESG